MVKIGQLRSEVFFKINIPAAKGAGYNDSWFDYGSTRGFLRAKSGKKQLQSGEIGNYNYHELFIRYQPYYARVDLKIVIDSREFTIETVINIEEGKKSYLRYTLNEKVSA